MTSAAITKPTLRRVRVVGVTLVLSTSVAGACSSESRHTIPAGGGAAGMQGGGGSTGGDANAGGGGIGVGTGGATTSGGFGGGAGNVGSGVDAGPDGRGGSGEAGPGQDGASEDRRPNIIVFLADDMGFSDPGAFGGEIHTPNIDALAGGGLRFTNFYNASRCSPTRASLLTGQYPHRVNLAANGRDLGRNGLTIAEALGGAGYKTAMVGKWHLSSTPELTPADRQLAWLSHRLDPGISFSPDTSTYPAGRGFQRHYGTIWGVVDYFDPFSLVDGFDPVPTVPAGFYATNAIAAKTVEYIRDFATQKAPFFLYVAHNAPHWPLQALPEDIAKYQGMYDDGWTPMRNARYERQKTKGLFRAENAPLPPTMGNDWSALTTKQRTFLSGAMRAHAAMVDRLDQSLGAMLDALRSTGKLDNTLILFLSDNGASAELYLQPGNDRPAQTRNGDTVVYCGGQASCPYDQPGDEKTWSYLGPSWANACNTPFRYWKISSFRGGNSAPFIVHWPAGLGTMPGAITEQPGHVMDILPTILELAGVAYPATFQGRTLTSMDGTSLAPIFRGAVRRPHERLFFEHEGGAAMIEASFKIARIDATSPWELYDLSVDRTETKDLAASDPARVQAMSATWSAWYASVPH
jgi:arylsulfatase